jgi:hypothetical protein
MVASRKKYVARARATATLAVKQTHRARATRGEFRPSASILDVGTPTYTHHTDGTVVEGSDLSIERTVGASTTEALADGTRIAELPKPTTNRRSSTHRTEAKASGFLVEALGRLRARVRRKARLRERKSRPQEGRQAEQGVVVYV